MKRALLAITCLLIIATFLVLQKNKEAHTPQSVNNDNLAGNTTIATTAPIAETTTAAPVAAALTTTIAAGKHLKGSFDISKYPAATQAKIRILNEIMVSKNDNDQRMDQDLKNLTSVDKAALKDFYQDLKGESLNERGTIVFLMGRGIQGADDVDFLKSILSEEPCLSMDNCAVHGVTKDTHLSSMEQISLSYPQQVAIESLTKWARAQNGFDSNIRQHLDDALRQAKRSPIVSIQQKANDLLRSLKR